MRFLMSSAGKLAPGAAGVMTTPGHKGIPLSIREGAMWAADNQAFTVGFSPSVFFPWLDSMKPYRSNCLFVTVPDGVGNAIETLHLWRNWAWQFAGWPLAFVAQDGQEHLPLPGYYDAIFIGGSTKWKVSQGAIDCIRRAQATDHHVHIGRVNWKKRYRAFRVLAGSKSFTCDGTRQRFDGVNNAHAAWSAYEAQPPLIQL